MGFFSKLWKGITGVFDGIVNIFKEIFSEVGKFFDSKIGKALMIGLSVFTLGTSLMAGLSGFQAASAAGKGFLDAFVQGGKDFFLSIVGKETSTTMQKTAEGVVQGADAAQTMAAGTDAAVQSAATANLPGAEITEAATKAATDVGQMTQGGGGNLLQQGADMGKTMAEGGGIGPTKAMAQTGVPLNQVSGAAQAADKGNWLSKAASAAGDFVTSEGGGQIVGSLIQGAGNYYTEKDRQEFEDRIRREWNKRGANPDIQDIRAQSARAGRLPIPSAQNVARTSRTTAQEGGQRPTFQRDYGAAAPAPAGG